MLKFLLGILSALADYFRNKQLIDAGKAEQELAARKEIDAHVEKAKDAVRVPDAARDERLRNRFDRSRRKG